MKNLRRIRAERRERHVAGLRREIERAAEMIRQQRYVFPQIPVQDEKPPAPPRGTLGGPAK